METLFIILIIIAIICILAMASKMKQLSDGKDEEALTDEKDIDTENGEAENSKEYPYEKTYLLTKNEWRFHKALKPIADKYNLHIIAKVGIKEFVSVKKGLSNKEYWKAFNKIKSKHVDFILVNPKNLELLCIIELDDKSHEKIERQQRDYFVDKVCETVKIPIIHCTDINGVEEQICEKIKIPKK